MVSLGPSGADDAGRKDDKAQILYRMRHIQFFNNALLWCPTGSTGAYVKIRSHFLSPSNKSLTACMYSL